jgi:hypothetical protein
METYWVQARVRKWLVNCFGQKIADDAQLRNKRFIEEAIELVQARGMTQAEAIEVLEYVYARPKGNQEQEVAGTMTTLMALCAQAGINIGEVTYKEIHRIETPEVMAKIRARQKDKPGGAEVPDDLLAQHGGELFEQADGCPNDPDPVVQP